MVTIFAFGCMISAPFCHQTLTLGGKISTSIDDFIALLNEALDATFPDTERVIITGGDYVKDIIIELRLIVKSSWTLE